MTAAFSAAMLLALPWVSKGDPRPLPLAGGLLALAVLAKGLVPLVLAVPLAILPVASRKIGRFGHLLSPRVIAPFLIISLPWYLLCYLRNGRQFLQVFFWQQQFERFRSPALEHTQPWWFYVPVLLAGLLPWTPLTSLVSPRRTWQDPRRRFLLIWVLFGLVFFSLAVNKLPGYVLPLLPALCALAGIGLADSDSSNAVRTKKLASALALAGSAFLLILFPIADQILPQAISVGLSRAPRIHWQWTWLLPLVACALVWMLRGRGRYSAALALIAVCAASGFFYLKFATLPRVDTVASARTLWLQIEPQRAETCIQNLNRSFRYGLNYYSDTPLPDCSAHPEPFLIRQSVGEAAGLVRSVVPSPLEK
jgi:4-amino-4-deoxy-L-arabinose transferase-like glycosyltransferase